MKKVTISHLVFETPEIVLDNYMKEAGNALGGIVKHLDSHKWSKAVYCQVRKNENEDWIRVGFVFLETIKADKEGKPIPSNGYRMFEIATLDEHLANIFLTHMCQAVALAGCNATTMPWSCAPITPNMYAIAPTKVIEKFFPPRTIDDTI